MENIALAGIIGTFNNVIDDVYDYGKAKLKQELSKAIVKKKIPELIRNQLDFVRCVKTLWQVDRAVDIDEFYCDSHLIAPSVDQDKKQRHLIKLSSDFSGSYNVAIRGIAGQGKSIFLRYLCIREFKAGQRIPIFIELRRIQKNESLFDHIRRFFEILNLSIDHDLFKVIAKSGKFIFFLDAFDEVNDNIKPKILNEIEYLASLCPDCQFIVTTRPSTAIEMSALFDVWTLDNLRDDEYKDVIKKLANTEESAKTIIEAIDSAKSSVSELLCTPLLVTLLILTYKSYQRIPEHLSDFYEEIFLVLLQRHDGTKPGFTRPRSCLINDSQYRDIFDTLCYESKKMKKLTFSYQDLYGITKKSMSVLNIAEDPDKYLGDIVTITCLILHEGEEYRFIHRSVQDYYAATFIKSRPDSIVERFYTACMDMRNWLMWSSEIEFLASIDRYRYSKYFTIPLCRNWLGVESDDVLLSGIPTMTQERAKYIIGDVDIGLSLIAIGQEYQLDYIGVGRLLQICDTAIVLQLGGINYDVLLRKLQRREIKVPKKRTSPDPSADYSFTLEQIFDYGFLTNELMGFAHVVWQLTFDTWESAYEYTSHIESYDIVSDFLSNN